MALENFKKTLWEQKVLENFNEVGFIGEITTPPTEVRGEKVIFNRITPNAWKDYQAGTKITWDTVASTKVEMAFDKQKYWAVQVDDVDKVQADNDVLGAVTKGQSGALGEIIDQEVVKYVIANTEQENIIAAAESKINITKENAYDTLVDMNVHMSDKKVPMADRYFIISNKYLGLLEKDDRFTKNYTILESGIIDGANINGAKLIVRADNPQDKILLMQKSGIGYAMQINETEAMRLQDYIGEGVRGLVSYGYTILKSECSVLANITI